MGHLFKNCRFTLSTESGVTTRSSFNPVYTPIMVEVFDGQRYIPVYGRTRSSAEMSKELFKWEKDVYKRQPLPHRKRLSTRCPANP